ncbi:hypothetical protein [Blastococcus sp. SYSU D01042]
MRAGELHLTIPAEQPLWCPDLHEEPLRVSCAFWMSGFEDRPEHSGELCIAEIFGDAVDRAPVQLVIGVLDFPARAAGRAPGFVPELVVSGVRGRSASCGPRRARPAR